MKIAYRPASKLFQRTALCVALSLSIFDSAQALTLSRPVVQSKQGEPLRVEIDISEISIAEQIELQASLASPDVYNAAKIELPQMNGQPLDIQVQLLRREHGWPYLSVTSKQAITNNFLDLLIDLRWSTGRLLRDISLSIDDPRTKKPTGPQVPSYGRQNKATNMPSLHDKNGQEQLRVKFGDTAGELMSDKTPDGVSLEQMLLALLRSNPEAFVESNVNRMKEGALLTLPTEQEAKSVSREEARRQIKIQAKDFEAYRAELAARAPGGVVPKVSRDSAGKLDATVQNNSAKTNQDKLTLAKPGQGDAAADKVAQEREAKDVAERAAELSRNITELGKIAAATVSAGGNSSEPASGSLPVSVPAEAASDANAWLDELTQHPLAPVGAGGLIGLLVLLGLWRRRSQKDADDIQGLPPLNVKFNLDLPENGGASAVDHDQMSHHASAHAHDDHHSHHADHDAHDAADEHEEEAYEAPNEQAIRPTLEMPNISLDLDNASTSSPYQVRMDLADELWNLGQLHTSKALMEEVANEASGADKEKALKWLAERG